jgi:hypothetical protein
MRWWEPLYARLVVELCLTPLRADAGADLLLLYPADAAHRPSSDGTGAGAWLLTGRGCLPRSQPWWPLPDPQRAAVSPLSGMGRDYMRVAGPGVYVGCAYREGPAPGELREESCVYFALARLP